MISGFSRNTAMEGSSECYIETEKLRRTDVSDERQRTTNKARPSGSGEKPD